MQVSVRCRRVELFYTDQRLSNKIIYFICPATISVSYELHLFRYYYAIR